MLDKALGINTDNNLLNFTKMEKIKGDTFGQRELYKVEKWARGISIHNEVDNQCCPDFSCCNKNVNTPMEVRKKFLQMYKDGEDVMPMLGEFLQKAAATIGKKIVVLGAESSTEKGNCSSCKNEFVKADLRPYGIGGAEICFDCAMLPENKRVTEKQFKDRIR